MGHFLRGPLRDFVVSSIYICPALQLVPIAKGFIQCCKSFISIRAPSEPVVKGGHITYNKIYIDCYMYENIRRYRLHVVIFPKHIAASFSSHQDATEWPEPVHLCVSSAGQPGLQL